MKKSICATADQRFWGEGSKIFLGDWCFPKGLPNLNTDDLVLENVFPDSQAIWGEYEYSTQVYLKLLPRLRVSLNARLGLNKSVAYYESLLGLWLLLFIQRAHEKYLVLKSVPGALHECNAVFVDRENWIPPSNFSDGEKRYQEADLEHQKLYSQIMKWFGIQGDSLRSDTLAGASGIVDLSPKSIKSRLIGFGRQLSKFSFSRSRDPSVICSYTGYDGEFLRRFGVGCVLDDFNRVDAVFSYDVDFELRRKFDWGEEGRSFEDLLAYLIPLNIPLVYCELLNRLDRYVSKVYPAVPKKIYTGQAPTHPLFAVFCAQNSGKSRLLIHQHGGNFGSDRSHTHEFIERRISDTFYTWGWTEDDRTQALSSPRLSKFRKLRKKHAPQKSSALLIMTAFPRYFFRACQYNIGSGNHRARYVRDIEAFLEVVKGYRVDVRPDPNYRRFGLVYSDWLVSHFSGRMSYLKAISEARICILGHIATAQIECMLADKPTLIFIQPDLYQHRRGALDVFQGLEDVGILHTSPNSAARKLREIFEDPLAWWNSPETISAREKYLEKFGRTSNSPVRDVLDILCS